LGVTGVWVCKYAPTICGVCVCVCVCVESACRQSHAGKPILQEAVEDATRVGDGFALLAMIARAVERLFKVQCRQQVAFKWYRPRVSACIACTPYFGVCVQQVCPAWLWCHCVLPGQSYQMCCSRVCLMALRHFAAGHQ